MTYLRGFPKLSFVVFAAKMWYCSLTQVFGIDFKVMTDRLVLFPSCTRTYGAFFALTYDIYMVRPLHLPGLGDSEIIL